MSKPVILAVDDDPAVAAAIAHDPVIDDLPDDWRQANPDRTSEVRVVGHRWSDRIVGGGPAGLAAACTRPRRAWPPSSWNARLPEGRQARARRSRTTSASREG